MTAALADPKAFAVWFKELERWSVSSFFRIRWKWPATVIRPLADALEPKNVAIDRSRFSLDQLQLVTLHFDGEMEPRDMQGKASFKGKLFFAEAGEVIYSKIDVRNGAIGVVPSSLPKVAVSSEYPVYHVRAGVALPEYVKLLFRTSAFRQQINSMISGASGRKRVQPSDLEEVKVPLPPPPVQEVIVAHWRRAQEKVQEALANLERQLHELDVFLRCKADMAVFGRLWIALSWCDMQSWDMKAARAAYFKLRNPSFRPLGLFAEEATELVKPWESPDKDWPVYGVNNKEGVFFSHHQKGKDFNAPYKRIRKDCFFHNPTRSSVGSLGIVPEVPEDALTSPEYQVWRIRAELVPGYVAVLIGTPFFIDLVQVHRVGAVKQRLYVENLLQIPVPVVPEAMQVEVADERERLLSKLADARRRAATAQSEVEEMILGIRPVG
jgi:hypothetical protein